MKKKIISWLIVGFIASFMCHTIGVDIQKSLGSEPNLIMSIGLGGTLLAIVVLLAYLFTQFVMALIDFLTAHL